MVEQPSLVMAVRVDEAWRQRRSMRVEQVVIGVPRRVTDGVDAAVDDSHLRGASGRPRSVDDIGIDDERRG